MSTFMTIAQFQKHLHVSRSTVSNLVAGGMPILKIGRARRIDVELAEKWLAADGGADLGNGGAK